MFKRTKKQNKNDLPFDLINDWQNVIFSNAGIDITTDHETAKEALRKIILASSHLYSNIVRIDDGIKPIHFHEGKNEKIRNGR